MMEIPVEIPIDSDGFVRRECPSCTGEFKWHNGPTEVRPEDAADPPLYTCPLCGEKATQDQWFTQAQVELIHEVGLFYATDALNDAMKKATRNSKHITFTPGKNTQPAPTPLVEPDDMIIIEPPCHPWEPVKVPEPRADAQPLFCLVCGGSYSA